MKINNMKLSLTAVTFVALMSISGKEVLASGAYGSDVIVKQESHQTVDAGLADSLPQVGSALFAISGLITTSVLLKKTK